ncbi:hypothetical protein [Aureibacillus halotolerans]|uniref:Lipoprotein n=1 Tax=Aureibacillus halotolerans TaxID=1508390 RepID=A0A4R6TRE4_9BACI|nr:hypothetical protein [Aureibacillus halotolerans]TDQ34595.1 hypothetical protein EV213_12413 [Aureibacillus halotolerans]
MKAMVYGVVQILPILVVLMGCSSGVTSDTQETSTAKKPPSTDTIPQLTVTADEQPIPAFEGSYCWSSEGVVTCVDKSGPIETLEGETPTVVAPGALIDMTYEDAPEPKEFQVRHLNIGEVALDNGKFLAPETPGVYYYKTSGRWEQGSASSFFFLEVR